MTDTRRIATRNGRPYGITACPECHHQTFLFPLSKDGGEGFCEYPKCGYKSGFGPQGRGPGGKKG
jgi:hypothetical protein